MATSDWLLLRLPAEGRPLSWAAADATGQLLSVPSSDPGGGLHTLSTGRRVALLVPGADVSHFEIPLPSGNEAKLLQLAPFALEDQVSEDVDRLHFAVGSRDAATGLVPVAVTDRQQMQQWLAQAAELQLLPRAVFAESDLAPLLPGHVTMLITGEQLLMRNDAARPVLLPAADPALALDMLLGPDADPGTVHLVVHASPEDWPGHAAAIERLRDRVASFRVQLSSGGLLALFAQGLAQSAPVNLLQGEFRPQQSERISWHKWRGAAALALVLLVIHAGASWWSLRQLRAESARLDDEIAQLYSAIFPGQAPGADPRRTLEQRLQALAGESGRQGELLAMLAAVAAARQNVPVRPLQSLTFRPGSLQLRLEAPDATTLEQFNQALRAGGYTASLTSGGPRGATYEGLVEIKAPGT